MKDKEKGKKGKEKKKDGREEGRTWVCPRISLSPSSHPCNQAWKRRNWKGRGCKERKNLWIAISLPFDFFFFIPSFSSFSNFSLTRKLLFSSRHWITIGFRSIFSFLFPSFLVLSPFYYIPKIQTITDSRLIQPWLEFAFWPTNWSQEKSREEKQLHI